MHRGRCETTVTFPAAEHSTPPPSCLVTSCFTSSINQSVYLSRSTRHQNGHQWRMRPPLTVARKNNVVKTTNEDTKIKNKLIYRKMFKSNIHHKTQQSPFKTRNTCSNSIWQFVPEVNNSIMKHISITNI